MTSSFQQVSFVTVNENNEHQRIDNFLMLQLKGVPKGKIYKILRKGEVRVNKKRAKPDYKLKIGDEVRIPPVRLPEPGETPTPSSNIQSLVENSVLFEDDRLLIVNKPSGIAVHGGSGVNLGIIEILRASRPASAYLELVHRIDRDTSGCLIIAKKRSALRAMHEQLREKSMQKIYHAIVNGDWDKSIKQCNAPLHKNLLQGGQRIVKVDEEAGKASKTTFALIRQADKFTLIEARPITGRTHQIRVHCAVLGYPIANDDKYGDSNFDKYIKQLGCSRLCLHAYSVSFTHPKTLETMTVVAPYDKQFSKVTSHCS